MSSFFRAESMCSLAHAHACMHTHTYTHIHTSSTQIHTKSPFPEIFQEDKMLKKKTDDNRNTFSLSQFLLFQRNVNSLFCLRLARGCTNSHFITAELQNPRTREHVFLDSVVRALSAGPCAARAGCAVSEVAGLRSWQCCAPYQSRINILGRLLPRCRCTCIVGNLLWIFPFPFSPKIPRVSFGSFLSLSPPKFHVFSLPRGILHKQDEPAHLT